MIQVNGKNYNDKENIQLNELLQQFGYQLDAIIVKHNQNIVKFNQFSTVTVKDGDLIKVFPFVGGG